MVPSKGVSTIRGLQTRMPLCHLHQKSNDTTAHLVFAQKKKSKKKRKHYLLFLCCVFSAHLPHVRAPLGDWTSRNGMRGPGMMSQTVDGRTLRSKIGSREAFHRASWRKWAPATTLQFKTGLRRATKKKKKDLKPSGTQQLRPMTSLMACGGNWPRHDWMLVVGSLSAAEDRREVFFSLSNSRVAAFPHGEPSGCGIMNMEWLESHSDWDTVLQRRQVGIARRRSCSAG